MVVKKTWEELLTEIPEISGIIDNDVTSLCAVLDEAFQTKYGSKTAVSEACLEIKQLFLIPECIWSDLPIFMSSYKLRDVRIARIIRDNLVRYIIFLTKMINDDGLTRKMVTSRNFENSITSTGNDKNTFSELPQIELDNFEEGIKYASNLSNNDSTSTSSQDGTSGETVRTTSWEEGMKNLRYAFFNDIIQYISDIPNNIYNYYSLDSRPVTELCKARRELYKSLYNL